MKPNFSIFQNNNNKRNGDKIENGYFLTNKKNIYSILMIIFIITILSSHIKVNAYYDNGNNNNNDNHIHINNNNDQVIPTTTTTTTPIILYSKIKIINTVIESDGVDIIFNNSVSFKNLPYLSVSEYITIPIGLLYIDLFDSQTKKHLEFKRFQIENDTDYTIITTGKKQQTKQQQQQQQDNNNNNNEVTYKEKQEEEESNYSITILSDNFNFPTLNKRTTLRFIHCSPDLHKQGSGGGVDFNLLNAATLFSNVSYIGDREHMKSKSYGASTNFISIPKNNPYLVFISEHSKPKLQITTPENLHPAYDNPCTISFLLIGSLENPKYPLQIFSITYPLPSTHASSFSEKQQQLLSINNNHLQQTGSAQQHQTQPNIPSSTSPSSSTFLKFSIAVLSFVLLALLSVV